MKKTLVALAVSVCSTYVLAFDMGEWTRNASSSQSSQQVTTNIESSSASAQQPKISTEEKKNEVRGAIYDSFEMSQQRQAQQANSNHTGQSNTATSSNRQNTQQRSVNQTGYQNHSSNAYSMQGQHQSTQSSYQRPGNTVQHQQAVQGQISDDTQRPHDLTPQMEAQLNREAAAVSGAMNQIMRITTQGYSVNSSQKAALDSFNAALQMMAGIWVSSSTPAEKQQINFELYNYAVACTTQKGVSNQARSLLGAYGQISALNGFAQFVQGRGKTIGTTGPTLGC